MSPLKHSKSFAARMGRWSANHWKTAVAGWLLFVAASVRRLEPPRRCSRRARCDRGTRLEKNSDRLLCTLPRVLLDVMRALGRARTTRGQRVGGACVRGELPAGRRRLVYRPPDERVAEDETARHGGRAEEVERQQRIQNAERVCGGSFATAAARSGSKGSPATAAP